MFCFVLLEGSVQKLCPKSLSLKRIKAPQGRWHLFLRMALGQDAKQSVWNSGSQLVVILPPSDIWQFLETFLVVITECYLILRNEEARDAAKHPTMYRTAHCNKHYLAQNAKSAEVEKPQVRGICTHHLQTEKSQDPRAGFREALFPGSQKERICSF